VSDLSKELARLNENGDGNLIFGGLKEVKRSFTTACRANKITNLRKHDFRHAFVSRSILARLLRLDLERGIPERIRTAAGKSCGALKAPLPAKAALRRFSACRLRLCATE